MLFDSPRYEHKSVCFSKYATTTKWFYAALARSDTLVLIVCVNCHSMVYTIYFVNQNHYKCFVNGILYHK